MSIPDCHLLELHEGVVREPTPPDDHRLILWIPGTAHRAGRQWQRVSSVRGDISEDDGICSIPATSIRATQEPRGFLGRLVQRFRKAEDARVWTLPSGEPAGQDGQPQNDLVSPWPTFGPLACAVPRRPTVGADLRRSGRRGLSRLGCE